ncbi:MAG: tRNA pseudouridine(38-40) synthase TruA [Pleurocapsa minor GSE-CHR-MK-17-07R]|jgi:tRNA pseudouridine38-40 synthase|nr:tRNA pseudouridine(38-40) synthase TruA [Pleurocapsa minor GSE-CHR-MK 17-07R]
MELRRFRAVLAYDGTAYCGFQRQAAGLATIQGAVEDALHQVTGQRVTVIGAGRTDTGVHAAGQVIAFDVPWAHRPEALMIALNMSLPGDIALQSIRQHEGFHPRFDAVSRIYNYTLFQTPVRQPLDRHRAWQVWGRLDAVAVDAAAALLIGRRNFAALGHSPSGENTVRTVMRSAWQRSTRPWGTVWEYTIEGDAFLQHMVRRAVGAMVDVGRGRMTVEELAVALEQAALLRVHLAPPHGLVLTCVRYRDEADGLTQSLLN